MASSAISHFSDKRISKIINVFYRFSIQQISFSTIRGKSAIHGEIRPLSGFTIWRNFASSK